MTDRLLGVCYYPEHWPRAQWAHDAARMAEIGISHVRIAEFAWSRIEPARGDFRWDWLDEAVATLSAAGLKIVMCTPTATPPRWLVDEMPDMLPVGADGRVRGFGSRRHYDFAHGGYREESARIATAVAARYGEHPHVAAWQTDNEYGCHETTISYGPASAAAFRVWCERRYGTLDALNEAWGNVFWSMEYASFDAIEPPVGAVTETNPAHRLAYRRFASDMVREFNRLQADIIRAHSPGRPVSHNFMGNVTDFDHFDVSADLEIATWDSYPLGFLEQFGSDPAWKAWYLRAGDPDFQAFHHDLYRACGSVRSGAPAHAGRWWVMEQQPGPVNWAPWNPAPHPGMVRLWHHEAFAHGAQLVSVFRWRQAPFAQEQFHTGLLRADGTPDVACGEVAQVAGELADLPAFKPAPAPVALIVDYPSIWSGAIQPQGCDQNAFAILLAAYRALRLLGQSVDILSPAMVRAGQAANHALVVAPFWPLADARTVNALAASGATVLFGPRTGSRTAEHAIPEGLAPGPLHEVLPMRVERVESLRPGAVHPVKDGGALVSWAEDIAPGEGTRPVMAREDGAAALLRHDRLHYLAGLPDPRLAGRVMRHLLDAAGLEAVETGDDLRVREMGVTTQGRRLRAIVNYGPKAHDAGHLIERGERILLGARRLPVAGVTIVERPS